MRCFQGKRGTHKEQMYVILGKIIESMGRKPVKLLLWDYLDGAGGGLLCDVVDGIRKMFPVTEISHLRIIIYLYSADFCDIGMQVCPIPVTCELNPD
jgi:hypothetical protein